MSAEIISLEAWRRRHCAAEEPTNRSVTIPCLLPTWPWLWLQPTLVEIDVGMIAEFGALAACIAGQASFGGLFYPDHARQPQRGQQDYDARDNLKSAVIRPLFRASAGK
jgi:hypothetical protein